MATGKRLLEESMPNNFKQGMVYPTHYISSDDGKRYVGKIRKAGQTKVRRQLKKDMMEELYDDQG